MKRLIRDDDRQLETTVVCWRFKARPLLLSDEYQPNVLDSSHLPHAHSRLCKTTLSLFPKLLDSYKE